MCQLKSGLVLKNRVFVPDYDSHDKMLKELGIEDNAINAMKTFVRFELSPVDDDIFSDIDSWKLAIDQDILPDWWDEEEYKPKVVEAVKEWASEHIYINKKDLELSEGVHYAKDSIVRAYGNSIVRAYGNSTVNAYHNSTVKAWNNSTVKAWNNSTVKAWNNSTVEAWNNSTVNAYNYSTVEAWNNSTVNAYNYSTVEAWNNSTVEAWNNSTVNAYNYSTVTAKGFSTIVSKYAWDYKNLKLTDNSTYKDCCNRKIYQAGDWEIVKV